MLELSVKIREVLGKKVKTLRKKGSIPAVLYGEKTKSMPLEIDYKKFEKVYKEVGESTIVKLKVKSSASAKASAGKQKLKVEEKNVLIYDVARDPVTDKIIHIDFYEVRMDKPITAEVPLVFEGEALAVKDLEGVLIKNITEMEVEALPADFPREIKVDISTLNTFDDLIHVKDLKIPEEVKVLVNPDEIVALVSPPRSEEELKALEEKVVAPSEEPRLERGEKVEEVKVVEEEKTATGEKAPKAEIKEEEKEKK